MSVAGDVPLCTGTEENAVEHWLLSTPVGSGISPSFNLSYTPAPFVANGGCYCSVAMEF